MCPTTESGGLKALGIVGDEPDGRANAFYGGAIIKTTCW